MPDNQQIVKILGGRSVVQFAALGQTDRNLLPAFDPVNVQHLLTMVEEPINGWKTYTHTFQAKDRDYVDSLLRPFLAQGSPPMLSVRFGLVADSDANWRPWEDHILLGNRIAVRADPQSGPLITIRTVDRLWLLHSIRMARAHRGLVSDIVARLWEEIGGENSLIEPTTLAGHTVNTGVWYQGFESSWSFLTRNLLPLASNSEGVSSYRIFIRDNTLHFHSPGYKISTPKKLLYSTGTPGFETLSVEDRFIEMAGGGGAAGFRRVVYDPLTGEANTIESDPSRLTKFAGARPEYPRFEYRFGHVGGNLLAAENARNQQQFSVLSSEVFSITFTASKCMDIQVGDVLDIVLTGSLAEFSLHSGLWLVTKIVHTLDQGSLSSSYVVTRGDFNLPSEKNILGPEEVSANAVTPGVSLNPDVQKQIPTGQMSVITEEGVTVPIQEA